MKVTWLFALAGSGCSPDPSMPKKVASPSSAVAIAASSVPAACIDAKDLVMDDSATSISGEEISTDGHVLSFCHEGHSCWRVELSSGTFTSTGPAVAEIDDAISKGAHVAPDGRVTFCARRGDCHALAVTLPTGERDDPASGGSYPTGASANLVVAMDRVTKGFSIYDATTGKRTGTIPHLEQCHGMATFGGIPMAFGRTAAVNWSTDAGSSRSSCLTLYKLDGHPVARGGTNAVKGKDYTQSTFAAPLSGTVWLFGFDDGWITQDIASGRILGSLQAPIAYPVPAPAGAVLIVVNDARNAGNVITVDAQGKLGPTFRAPHCPD